MTRITAFIIATNDVNCDAGGPDENGKWAGWISRMERENYRPLISTEPVYDSKEEAVAAMEDIVKSVKDWVDKECDGKDPREHLLGQALGN